MAVIEFTNLSEIKDSHTRLIFLDEIRGHSPFAPGHAPEPQFFPVYPEIQPYPVWFVYSCSDGPER